MTSSNFVFALLLGGSMQSLWSLIRSMQLIILASLLNVLYPPHAQVFFEGAILFASMDVFQSEELYAYMFEFLPTEPLTPKFETFKIGDKTFLNNSGPLLIL